MSDPHRRDPFPRKVLIAFGSLILFSLVLVVGARLTGYDPRQMPPSPVVQSRDISFVDQPDGTTLVKDAADGQVVATLPSGGEGFIRGVLRATARPRHASSVPPAAPYRLAQLADGRLTLTDLSTQRVIELVSFGPTNIAAFAAFLPAKSAGTAPGKDPAAPRARTEAPR